jgi:hypothetical protein
MQSCIKSIILTRVLFTLNKGIDIAKGSYIARMDGDDIALPEVLKNN